MISIVLIGVSWFRSVFNRFLNSKRGQGIIQRWDSPEATFQQLKYFPSRTALKFPDLFSALQVPVFAFAVEVGPYANRSELVLCVVRTRPIYHATSEGSQSAVSRNT